MTGMTGNEKENPYSLIVVNDERPYVLYRNPITDYSGDAADEAEWALIRRYIDKGFLVCVNDRDEEYWYKKRSLVTVGSTNIMMLSPAQAEYNRNWRDPETGEATPLVKFFRYDPHSLTLAVLLEQAEDHETSNRIIEGSQ